MDKTPPTVPFFDVRMRGFPTRADVDTVVNRLRAALVPLGPETVALDEAAARVLFEAITAAVPVPHFDRAAFDGAVLSNADTERFVHRLVAMTVEERRALPYMHPGRADVIDAGALIWTRILARVPVPEHVVSEADILHGIAADIAR